MPSGDDEVVTIVRDFTEQRRAEAEQRRLAEEQAALRRVATLVAGNAPPERGLPDGYGGGLPVARPQDGGAPPLRGRTNVDDRRQVRRVDRPLRARQRHRARGRMRHCRCCKPERPPDRTTTSSTARAQPSCASSDSPAASACRSQSRASPGAPSSSPSGRRRTPSARDRAPPASVRGARRPRALRAHTRARRAGRFAPAHRRGGRRRATPASSATCTTERNSDWSRSRSGLRFAQAKLRTAPEEAEELLEEFSSELARGA